MRSGRLVLQRFWWIRRRFRPVGSPRSSRRVNVVRRPVPTIEGPRVYLSRVRAVSAVFLPLVLLMACSSAGTDAPAPGVLDGITVSGTSKAPTVTFKTKPLSVNCLLYTSDAADDLLCVDLGG